MSFSETLLSRGAPEAPALITEQGSHSYAELRQAATAVSARLAQEGVHVGDRVGLLAENGLFGIAAYLGILRAGATAVPLPTTVSAAQCALVVERTGMRVVFVQEKVQADFAAALEGVTQISDAQPLTAAAPPPPALVGDDAIAVMLFTSGSTAEPRGVMLSHGNLRANTDSIQAYLGLLPSDRAMMVLPFYYSFGASLLHTHLAVGATLVLDRRFMFPDKVLKRMQETECTGFAGVPSHFQILLRRSKLKSMQFPALRWLQQAGGKLAPHFITELAETLPGAKLFIMYGATEATARIAYLPPDQVKSKLGSVGRAIPGVTLEILTEEGKPVAPGEVGEIVVSGANVAQGYFGKPKEEAATFRQGRLHTGDLARMDDDGFVFIVDRAKDFIKVAGSRVSTKLLEETLLQFPDVVELAVLSIPDETLGEAVAAFVVPRDGTDATVEARLLAFAAEKLPGQLVPKRVERLLALPKNNAGKVQRPQLRALLAEVPTHG